jgi:GT2 family glycosyltransferase/glycosyltransferase involved in cell wall biosynthesis
LSAQTYLLKVKESLDIFKNLFCEVNAVKAKIKLQAIKPLSHSTLASEKVKSPDTKQKHSSAKVIIGSFDECEATCISGWAADSGTSVDRMHIEILADGILLTQTVANVFRADLVAAGIGDGKFGFKVMLPEALLDGSEHMIEVREISTGSMLAGSPKTFRAIPIERGNIVLEGSNLVGWARLPEGVDASLWLEIMENENIIGAGRGVPDAAAANLVHFRLPLPASVFDGRAHSFSVRSNDPAMNLGEIVLITPHMMTPEASLQQYAREGLKPSLSAMAGFRYESLANAMALLADNSARDFAGNVSGARADFSMVSDEITQKMAVQKIAQIVHTHAQLVRGFNEADKIFEPLSFPEIKNPRVSIVIPVHNKFYVTYHCLSSLLLSVNRTTFEVILVDDGSRDESKDIPKLINGVQYVRNEEAQGFIHACNLGGSLAHGEYIVMLNNDTEATSGWLDELLWPFEHFNNVGMTGAKLLYPNGTLQEAGGIVWDNCDPWNYGRQANPHEPRYSYARQVDYLSGACIMLPTKLWNEIGGFSETYVPAYFEDTDLAFQVRDKGYKTIYAPLSQVIHFEGISSGTSTTSGMKRFQEINRPKFKNRWGAVCRHNGKVGVDVELNKDRNVAFRVLVLDAETPMPDQNAGSYAAIQEMRMLQALGCKCTFVPENMAWMSHYTEALQRMGVECLYAPFALSINEIIATRGHEFDVIYITRFYVAQNYIDLIRKHAPRAKIVLMNADLHFLRELRAALVAKSSELIASSVNTRDAELATMRKVDLVLSYTDVEKAVILSHNLDSTRVAKCPWVTEVVSKVPGFDARTDIAFLGGYNHYPNVEAVEWFIDKVMPSLRGLLPGIKFRIYGSNVPKRLLALADKHQDVFIEGWVANVDAVYNTCRIFIAPLQSGAGIKGKVIGALAYGVPCVLSPIAAEGIALGDGVDASLANKPEEWALAIARLYQNPKAWADMSRQALAFALNQYGFSKGVALMQDALREAEIFTTIENNTLTAH